MVANIHRLDLVDIAGQKMLQVSSTDWDPGIKSMLERGAGGLHPLFGAHQVQEPEIKFDCTQLDDLLSGLETLNATAGGALLGAALTTAVKTYFKKGVGLGSDARANATHTSGVINYSYVRIDRIRLPHNGAGSADVTVTVGYDGVNEPIVWTGNVALDPTNPTHEKCFGAGPCYLNGVLVEGITDVDISPGCTLEVISSDTVVWPTWLGLRLTEPTVKITTLETVWQVTAGQSGQELTAPGVEVYGRKFTKNQNGGLARVANASPEHLYFQGEEGRYFVEPGGKGSTPIETVITCELTSQNDTVIPLTSALSAIP